MQPTPVLSLGSDLRSPSLSSQLPSTLVGEQKILSGWWVLVGTDPLCGNLSALPSAPLLLRSPPWFRSFPLAHPLFPPVKGLPSVWKLFLLHSSLPDLQVPSLFFVSVFPFFFCPTQEHREFLAFWEVWGLLPAFSRCSVGVVPHVDVFLTYLWGGRWSPRLTPPPSWRSCKLIFLYLTMLSVKLDLLIFSMSVYEKKSRCCLYNLEFQTQHFILIFKHYFGFCFSY